MCNVFNVCVTRSGAVYEYISECRALRVCRIYYLHARSAVDDAQIQHIHDTRVHNMCGGSRYISLQCASKAAKSKPTTYTTPNTYSIVLARISHSLDLALPLLSLAVFPFLLGRTHILVPRHATHLYHASDYRSSRLSARARSRVSDWRYRAHIFYAWHGE